MTDVLRFENGPAQGTVVWTGPWPPPDPFAVLVGKTTGEVAHVGDPAPLDGYDEWRSHVDRFDYRCADYSKLPPMTDDSHVVRGASYVLDPA